MLFFRFKNIISWNNYQKNFRKIRRHRNENFLKNCRIHHHHHHVMPLAWISLTLSRHFSLSLIASGRSSGLHPVSSHSCCMYVRAGRPTFVRPYVGAHTSLKLVVKFTYLGSSVSSTEKYIDTRLTKAWTAFDKLSIIWKSDLTD